MLIGGVILKPGLVELEQDRNEGVLILEPVVDRPHRHPGFVRDLGDGDLLERLLAQQTLERRDQFVARVLGSGLQSRFCAFHERC